MSLRNWKKSRGKKKLTQALRGASGPSLGCQEAILKEQEEKMEACQTPQELDWRSVATGLTEWSIQIVVNVCRGGQDRGPAVETLLWYGVHFSQWCWGWKLMKFKVLSEFDLPCSTTWNVSDWQRLHFLQLYKLRFFCLYVLYYHCVHIF